VWTLFGSQQVVAAEVKQEQEVEAVTLELEEVAHQRHLM
jgi:hypothetical protein